MRLGRPGLLAVIAGGVAALGHAPFHLTLAGLLGFVGVFFALACTKTPRHAAFVAWAGGAGYFALMLTWIVEPFLVDIARHGWMAPFALVFMAGGLALFWGAAVWLAARFVPGGGVLVWAVALSAAEMVRGHVLSGFPWGLPGYIWIDSVLSQGAAFVGPYGLTFVTLLLGALPFAFRRVWVGALPVALVAAVSLMPSPPTTSSDTLGVVRLVQPNAPQDEKWDPEKAHTFVERQIEFTAAPKDSVDMIVWPETAVPYRLDVATPVLQRVAGASEGLPVMLGINRRVDGRNYNAMVTVGPTGAPLDIYDKVRLVPFGEFIPLGQLAELVGIRSFAARDGYGFSSGAEVRMVDTPLGRALPLICYEAIFPQHIRALDERPDYLLQITNDAWFGTFSGPFQHLDQARFRAIEQGLPVIRVANTGVSAVVGPYGEIVESIDLGVAGYLDVPVPRGHAPTLYSRIGDSPVLVLLSLLLAGLWFRARRNTIAKTDAPG